MRKWFRNASMRQKLIGVFLIIFLSAMVLMVTTSTVIAWKLSNKNAQSYSSMMLKELQKDLEYIVTDVENVSRFTMYEDRVQQYLRMEEYESGRYSAMLSVKETLVNVILNKDYIESISIYLPDGTGMNAGTSPMYACNYENICTQDWYEQVADLKGMFLWSVSEFQEGQPRITCARVLNDRDTIQPLGVLVILLNPTYMDTLFSENGQELDAYFCYDQNRQQVLIPWQTGTDSEQQIFSQLTANETAAAFMKNGYVYSSISTPIDGWILVNRVSIAYYWKQQVMNLGIIFFVTLISLVISMVAYRRFANSITGPISRLILSMEKAEKDNFKNLVTIERKDEIGRLGEAYNRLIQRVNVLVNDVLRERLHSQQAELENLQAQINPHFLYNTLDCINWKAMINGENEISDMITALSNMFRFSLSGNDKLVTVEEELSNVRDYLLIQQERFGDKLQCSMEVSEAYMRVRILKYILQPVVENSILHGIGETGEPEKVIITAAFCEQGVELCVLDDGPGVDTAAIEDLLAGRQRSNGKKHRHGIYNVNKRLQLQYGEAFGLYYSNRPEGGTCVRIVIPGEEN